MAAPGISEFERWTGVESICIAAWWEVLISLRITEMAPGSLQVGPGQISSEAVGRSTPLLIASCTLWAGALSTMWSGGRLTDPHRFEFGFRQFYRLFLVRAPRVKLPLGARGPADASADGLFRCVRLSSASCDFSVA